MSVTFLGTGIPWPNPLMIDPVNDPADSPGFAACATGTNRMAFVPEGSGSIIGYGKPTDRYEIQLVVKNTDLSNPHNLIFEHQRPDGFGTQMGYQTINLSPGDENEADLAVAAVLAQVTLTIPAGATQILGPFAEDGQWFTSTGTVSQEGGSEVTQVGLVTFHASDSRLQVAVMAKLIGAPALAA